jgi:hypothetical protein
MPVTARLAGVADGRRDNRANPGHLSPRRTRSTHSTRLATGMIALPACPEFKASESGPWPVVAGTERSEPYSQLLMPGRIEVGVAQ